MQLFIVPMSHNASKTSFNDHGHDGFYLLFSSKLAKSSSLKGIYFDNVSDTHECKSIDDLVGFKDYEPSIGIFSILSNIILQVGETHITVLQSSNEKLQILRSEPVSSLFKTLEKNKKTLDIASTFRIQFACVLQNNLFLIYEKVLLNVRVSGVNSPVPTFELQKIHYFEHSISGVYSTEIFSSQLCVVCLTFWDDKQRMQMLSWNSSSLELTQSNNIQFSDVNQPSVMKHFSIFPITQSTELFSFHIFIGSDYGDVYLIQCRYNKTSHKLDSDPGKLFTSIINGIRCFSTSLESSSRLPKTAVGKDHPSSNQPIFLINGNTTDYCISKRNFEDIDSDYSCIKITSSEESRQFLSFSYTKSFSSRQQQNGITCIWLQAPSREYLNFNLCIGHMPIRYSNVDQHSDTNMLNLEQKMYFDGIIESIQLSSDELTASVWCRFDGGTGGTINLLNARTFECLWQQDISSMQMDTLHFVQFDFMPFDFLRTIPSSNNYWFSCLSDSKPASKPASSILSSYHLSVNSSSCTCEIISQLNLPFRLPEVNSTSGNISIERYLGSGGILSVRLSRDMLVVIHPDRRLLCIGWTYGTTQNDAAKAVSEGQKNSDLVSHQLAVLAECDFGRKVQIL